MAYPVVPPPRVVAVELIGGPMCGAPIVMPIGPDSLPPPECPLPTDGGRYVRTERQVQVHARGGVYRTAYQWQAG